jgi:hypothetical protein
MTAAVRFTGLPPAIVIWARSYSRHFRSVAGRIQSLRSLWFPSSERKELGDLQGQAC